MRQAGKLLFSLYCSLLTIFIATVSIAADPIRAPGITIAGIHSPTLTANGAQLICSVRVENPNDVALPVTGGLVELDLDGSHAARGRPLRQVSIPAGGARNVDLLVDLTSSAAMAWLPMFMGDASFRLPYRVKGHVEIDRTGLGRVDFNETGSVAMTDAGLQVYPAE